MENNLMLNSQELQASMQEVKMLLKEEPNNPKYLQMNGDLLLQVENYSMATHFYERALQEDSFNAELYIRLGLVYTQQDRWMEAMGNFKSALTMDPENMMYMAYYGWSLYETGLENEDDIQMKTGFEKIQKAAEAGIAAPFIKHTMADYYIESARLSWPISDKGTHLATRLTHVTQAKKCMQSAEKFMDQADEYLRRKYNELKTSIQELETRRFNGYAYPRKAAIVVGVIFLLFGQMGTAALFFILAALYHYSQYKPGYLANRQLVKGNYGDPFWVRRINEVSGFFSSFTFFGSIGNVIFMNWAFSLIAMFFRYSMAIFMLPFLIVSGFIINYDLISKAKNMSQKTAVA